MRANENSQTYKILAAHTRKTDNIYLTCWDQECILFGIKFYYTCNSFCYYAYLQGTNFSVVKVLMATAQNSPVYTKYVTFEAETNSGGSVIFQTKIFVYYRPCFKIEISFVRIKPDCNNSQPSDLDHIAVVEEGALLSRVISTYTTVCLRAPLKFYPWLYFPFYCTYIYYSYI